MKNKRLIFAWIAFIFWVGLIFYMSNQSGDISSKQSGLVIKFFEMVGMDLNDQLGELATFLVRKAAHFTEYFILYFLTVNLIQHYFDIKKSILYGFVFCFLYACTDEIHQYFIPGRAMAFKDVLIDSSGALLGMIIRWLYTLKILRLKNIDKYNNIC